MSDIKAIETIYKGYRFRSRLEARWAVFFDRIGLRWQYEHEGWEIDGIGMRYLPDFYLTDWDVFLEIKPDLPQEYITDGIIVVTKVGDDGRHEYTPLGKFMLAADGLDKFTKDGESTKAKTRLYMACGTPGLPRISLVDGRWKLMDGSVVVGMSAMPIDGIRSPILHINAFSYTRGGVTLDVWPFYIDGAPMNTDGLGVTLATELSQPVLPGGRLKRWYIGAGVDYAARNLIEAYRATRSARFEYGETAH